MRLAFTSSESGATGGWMDRESIRANDEKKAYHPPQLKTISLRPEEAVLGACKTLNSGGKFAGTCNFFGIQPCGSNVGS